jgi:hypothetical protein
MLFFLGVTIGIAATLLFAMWLATKNPKSEAVKPVCHVASSGVESVNVLGSPMPPLRLAEFAEPLFCIFHFSFVKLNLSL